MPPAPEGSTGNRGIYLLTGSFLTYEDRLSPLTGNITVHETKARDQEESQLIGISEPFTIISLDNFGTCLTPLKGLPMMTG